MNNIGDVKDNDGDHNGGDLNFATFNRSIDAI
jgi:hypothetical protein